MNFPAFFINRPIFAMSVSILMVFAGVICAKLLPVAMFPEIVPPQVSVSAYYTGASADVVADVITTPMEEAINGVEGMLYMSSNSTNSGSSTINVTFDIGYDLNTAAVDVQNRVDQAMAKLPDEVQRSGVTINKVSNSLLVVLNLTSPGGTFDSVAMGNYAEIHLEDEIKRVPGVGSITIFGLKEYAIRIWLDPDRMSDMGLTSNDVIAAVREQNVQVAAGTIGAPPISDMPPFQLQVNTRGRLETAEEFGDIVVRVGKEGSLVRLKDVARVELGAAQYSSGNTLSGKPAAAIGVYQLPGANALRVVEGIEEVMGRLSKNFPDDLEYEISFDTTDFVRVSLQELIVTLIEAIGLVVLVVFVFLQSWRAAIIPVIAIPVSLIGTFAVMQAFGFSINTLTLLGLVLAIGLVVDDAIVVVENVERQLSKGNVSRRKAASLAMEEVTGPIVATTLVLLAVFIPAAFVPGISGQLYNQFALTIAFSVLLSSFNSLSLSPALCGSILRVTPESKKFVLFRGFNRGFDYVTRVYEKGVRILTRVWVLVVIGFIAVFAFAVMELEKMPTGFVPEEDQGYFFVSFEGPSSASLARTTDAASDIVDIIMKEPGVKEVITITGVNFLAGSITASNAGFSIPILESWDKRLEGGESVWDLMASLRKKLSAVQDVTCTVMNAPAIIGLGSTGGFAMQLRDLDAKGPEALGKVTQSFLGSLRALPEVGFAMSSYRTDVPQLYLDIDRTKAKSLQVPLADVFQALQVNLGSYYINDFNRFGRVYEVKVQADGQSRRSPEDIGRLWVRNTDGEMIPMSSLIQVEATLGADNLPHYNLYNTAQVIGESGEGFSSGQAISAIDAIRDKALPQGFDFQWTDVVYQQIESMEVAPIIFGLALVVVFLFLASLYESWTMPFMVLLTAPLALVGALLALQVRSLDLNVYGQIGLVMLIGLAAKNAILIIEFAKRRRDEGLEIVEAAMEAARLRLRPILMTAFAFILGVVPLVFAEGAGASSRESIGTTVFGGMIAATFLSLIVVPVFYVVIEKMREKFGFTGKRDDDEEES